MNEDLVSATPLNGTHLKFSFFPKDEQNYFLGTVEEEIKLPIYLPRVNQLELWEICKFSDYYKLFATCSLSWQMFEGGTLSWPLIFKLIFSIEL